MQYFYYEQQLLRKGEPTGSTNLERRITKLESGGRVRFQLVEEYSMVFHPLRSPPDRTPPMSAREYLLYDQAMKREKRPSGAATLVLWLFGGILAFSPLLASPASADIYRWEDGSGGVHFTDDPSTIPANYRGKAREIQKTPPAEGKPSVSTMGGPSTPPGPSFSPGRSNAEPLDRPAIPEDDDALLTEKLRAKIDAKERFLRGLDEKQSLSTNPYRNRFVSPPDLELYKKYKEELPADRERLKELESRLPPVREP